MITKIQKLIIAKQRAQEDPIIVALKGLTSDEIEVMREYTELCDAGFDVEDIKGMMQGGYDFFLNERYDVLLHDRK